MRVLLAIMMAAVALGGCVTESNEPESTWRAGGPFEVAFDGPVNGFGPTAAFPTNRSGNGIWIHEDLLYWSNGGVEIFDVSDPTDVQSVALFDSLGSRDVDILEWQGAVYAILADSGRGMHVLDVTDPTAPVHVGTFPLPSAGAHNLAAVPGTPYIYSSGASGDRLIDVLDITDPTAPTIHTFPIPATFNNIPVNSNGCHDITVRVDLGRAYCAGGGSQYMSGGGESFIWDISESVTNPRWVAMIDDPRLIYHHQAFANEDGTLMIINDEYIAQNCVNAELPVVPNQLEPKVPFAAAWIYDISDEENPVQLSFVQNPSHFPPGEGDQLGEGNCGSHFGDIILGRDAFVMGWYQGGTMMVDFSTPSDPVIVDIAPALGSTWDAQYYKGHVYHSGADLQVTPII